MWPLQQILLEEIANSLKIKKTSLALLSERVKNLLKLFNELKLSEWFDKGAHQFNAFGWMPVSGTVSNWRIEMEFNHPVSSVQCWKAKPKKLSDDGRTWELTPMSYNKNLNSKLGIKIFTLAEKSIVLKT